MLLLNYGSASGIKPYVYWFSIHTHEFFLYQEPHMEVLTPTSKSVQNYVGNRLLVYLYREFREKEKPGVITPHVRADDVVSQFPSLTEGFIRKRLKHCADLQVGLLDS